MLIAFNMPTSANTLSGTAQLTGQTDSAGIVVALAGPATAVTVTSADGRFSFPNLAAGSYAVTAAAPSTIEEQLERTAVITAGLGTAAGLGQGGGPLYPANRPGH